MDWAKEFFIQNFILLLLAVVVYISAIVRYKAHPRVSVYTTLIMSLALALAVFQTLENYAKYEVDPDLTLTFSILGYTLRPVCIYLFFLLNDDSHKGKLYFLTALPLLVNFLIYNLAYVPDLSEYVVKFNVEETPLGPEISFHGGFLRFFSHIISALYLLALIYVALTTVKFKRLFRALSVLTCSFIVIIAVVIESFFNAEGKISILNTAIAISVLIYYLYLNIENAQIDRVTGLYNDETYNVRIDQINQVATGVMLFKLPLISNPNNDSKIYEENNKLSKDVAHIILRNISRKMVVYRIEEATFLLVSNNVKKETFVITFDTIKNKFTSSEYDVDMGYGYKTEVNQYVYALINEAERMIKVSKPSKPTQIQIR